MKQTLDLKPTVVAPAYLVAHACFACRKSWKIGADASATCPECGNGLSAMGRSFKAPKQSDTEQWTKVQALWSHGFRFTSFRSHAEAEPFPERLKDVDGFVQRNPNHPARVLA